MRKAALILFLFLPACAPAPEPTDRPETGGEVAAWIGGQVGLPEIESRYPTARTPACRSAHRGDASVDLLVPCYREIAEEIVLEQQLLAEIGEPDTALLDDSGAELSRHAHLVAFQSRVRDEIEVTEEEILALYEERRETLQRPATLSLWNLFRRHQNPEKPEETTAFLHEIKSRVETGETFQSLARQYSDSETRLRDGFVGRISEGDLPAGLEEVAFGLDTGQVSEPIPVRGGAVLLYVRDPLPGFEPQLTDLRQALRMEVQTEKLRERLRERAEGQELPRGSTVFGEEELAPMVAAGNGSEVVLEIGDRRITVTELREMTGLSEGELTAQQREHLDRIYIQLVESERLYLDILTADDPLATAVREDAVEHLRQETIDVLLNQALDQDVAARVDADVDTLKQYYDDNEHHYQSPLRFRLRLWSQPFGSDPPSQLAAMERARAALTAGERELDDVVSELGGEIQELGWRELDSLSELPGKAQSLLLQSEPGGYSVPYQQGEVLYLIEVTERSEPERLAYQEVAERVREDYQIRFAQRLTREVVESRLTDADFQFYEDQVRSLLEGP